MKIRRDLGLAGLALMLLGVSGAASADMVYTFNSTAVGAFGAGPFGTVTLSQNGANVDVTVDLRDDAVISLNFVNTGGPHAVFSFNATGVVSTDITNVLFNGAANAAYSIQGPGTNTPFGTFTFLLDCTSGTTGCSNGAGGQQSDPLTFTVLNALESELAIANSDGFYYAADVICVSGSRDCNGSTGGIGSTGSRPPDERVPEPASLALLGLGLLGFGAARRRRLS